jgi:topoisomerase-4 subunit A
LNPNEKIVKSIVVSDFKDGIRIALATKKGQIKKVLLKDFETQKFTKPIRCIKVGSDDELVDAVVLHGNTNILVINSDGYSSYYNESEVSEFGLKAGGIKAISTKANDVIALLGFEDEERSNICIVTNGKAVRIVDSIHLQKTARLGAKQQLFKSFKSDPQKAIFVEKVERKADNVKVNALLENTQLVELSLEEFKPQPFESYIKTSNDVDSPFLFVDAYLTFVDRVDEKTNVVKIQKKIEVVKKQEEDDFEQLSLFDFVDDD